MADTVKARETEFFIRRQVQLPGNQVMEINLNIFAGEDEATGIARIARAEHMMDLVSYRHQLHALEENIKATKIQMQSELDVLEDLQGKAKGVPAKNLKPNQQAALTAYPLQIEQKKQGLLIMENRCKELRVLLKDFE